MLVNQGRAAQLLRAFEFATLFVEELGWERCPSGATELDVDGRSYSLSPVAEKRGVRVLICRPQTDSAIPPYKTRQQIYRHVRKLFYEHLLVFVDQAQTSQVWQWVAKEPGRSAAYREHSYNVAQSGAFLIQKLELIAFRLSEEEALTLTGVTYRLRDAFDRDRVTKRFYDRFKLEHKAFLKVVEGIQDLDHREWYASVMLNRLMFVYFIQRKGFLDGDPDYLKNHLAIVQRSRGADEFFSFYRHFLLRLFHEGLGSRGSSKELDALLGNVPYLNGGLFDIHQLERAYPEIAIPDQAFEKLFAFFDSYQWHLDERPLRSDNEINPDVLGYIFEKYINQREMGAYYTREDITNYISERTVLPWVLEATASDCAIAFREDGPVWGLLREDPSRYLPRSLRHGVDQELPEDVEVGESNCDSRAVWNDSADPGIGLPAETWRECVRRRERYQRQHEYLETGRAKDVSALITLNLDIRQFLQDAIEASEGPELLRAFYSALTRVKVLDPTCGSGAFLFAALNILEPLYESCLDRMQSFVDDNDRLAGWDNRAPDFAEFRQILDEVATHPGRRYFILKSIVIRNLYGVDLMDEAVEICKLRLFLKLIAQVSDVAAVEPLPDVDFNIRAGNTLVGFATLDAVREAVLGETQARLDLTGSMDEIAELAAAADTAYRNFQALQLSDDSSVVDDLGEAKEVLASHLASLGDRLNRYLAWEYGVDPTNSTSYESWLSGHHPLHWFTEFHSQMSEGGFDAVIGNPPYLEVNKLNGAYRPLGLRTLNCRDIYAWVLERAFALSSPKGHIGLIVPVSVASAEAFSPLREVLQGAGGDLWLSHYANRPGQLFSGAQNRLTILLHAPAGIDHRAYSTRYHRWDAKRGEREVLFDLLEYQELGDLAGSYRGLLPKVGSGLAAGVLRKLRAESTVADLLVKGSESKIYWVRVPGYFCQFYLDPPMARPEDGGDARQRGELISISVRDERTRRVLHALLSSSTYYQFYVAYSDGRHINPSDVAGLTFDLSGVPEEACVCLVALSQRLEEATREHTTIWRKSGLLIDSLDSRPLKPLLDEIDGVMAGCIGLSDEELDFVVNYDWKYRVG